MILNRQTILEKMREAGRIDALELRAEAAAGTVTDTDIIDREAAVPDWRPDTDYTNAPIGSPVQDAGQVYGLLQPHNASYYPDQRPADLRALWGLKHTTNPQRAKPYVAPLGTSGMYMAGECCLFGDDNAVYRSKVDNNVYSPAEYAQNWEAVEL